MGYAAAEEVKFDFTAPSKLTPSIADAQFSDAGNGAFEFATSKTTFNINGITINTTDGSTASRIWKASSGKYDLRLYKTATMTIAAPEGATITSIAFNGGTVNSFSADNGTLDGKNWTGSASKVVFTWSGDAKTQKINDITVTYTGGGIVTPEPEEPEQPGEGEGEEEEVEIEDIEVVLAAGAADKAKVQGTIVATYAKGFLLHDNTGDILVYLNNTHEYNVGNVVTVAGATSMYGGLLQFGSAPTVELVDNTTVTEPAPVTIDGSGMDGFLEAPSIRYVVYTGKLTISGNYYNVAIEGASKAIASIQYPNTGLVPAEYNNGTVKVTGYLIGVSSSKYVNTMATKVELIEEGEVEPEEPETPITGEILTVSQALAKYVEGEKVNVKVRGFIVGAMNSTGYVPEFGKTGVFSNILLSDNADEDNIDNCLIIQLVSGTDIRAKLNMGDNPGNYKKEVIIEGSLEKYFQQAGIKNPTAAQFTNTTAIENVETEAENAVIYDLTGRRIDEITEAGIYIINGVKKIVR
jgi:hypothetical protein